MPDQEFGKKFKPILNDIVSPFDRPLTLISVYNIVYFMLKYFRFSSRFTIYKCSSWSFENGCTPRCFDSMRVDRWCSWSIFIYCVVCYGWNSKKYYFCIGSIVSGCGTLLVFYLRATFHSEIWEKGIGERIYIIFLDSHIYMYKRMRSSNKMNHKTNKWEIK